MAHADQPSPNAAFVTTRWTQVLQARTDSDEGRAALSDLCAAYYDPVLAFIRYQEHHDEDRARDLTQEFFAHLLEKGGLETADRARGRFRSFLLGAVKHFLAHERERAAAAKRGGGLTPVPLESCPATDTSTQLQIADPSVVASDALFDRQWALTLVGRALKTVAQELQQSGKGEQFEVLKPWLLGEVASLSQDEAGRRLGLSEGAVKVAIHRLRKRFREAVKREITETVGEAGDVQQEMNYLIEVLGKSS